jgi:hypothetical protein
LKAYTVRSPLGRAAKPFPSCGTKFWPEGEREPRPCPNVVERKGEFCSDEHAEAHCIGRDETLDALLLAIEWKQRPVTQAEVWLAATYGQHKDLNRRQIGFRLHQLTDDGLVARTSVPRRAGRGFPYLWAPTRAVDSALLARLPEGVVAEATNEERVA